MSFPFDEEQLAKLKVFVELCKNQPLILHHPKLSFFKEYLIMLGVTLPPPTFDAKNFVPSGDSNTSNNNAPEKPCSDEEAEVESDVELDMEGIIDLDPIDESQVMGDDTKEVTDEERDQSDEKRSEAMQAFSEQQFDNAIKLYSEAIQLNPQSALLFAKRGQVYLKMNKPNACIKDCTKALELNCDSAAAYKFRGRAHRLIGKWEEASHDLCESLKIDYDDQTNEWLNEVKPNAEKLRQHKLGVQRKKEEKEHRDKLRRARASREQPAAAPAGAGGAADFSNLFDQDIMAAFQDPEIAVAFADVTSNPANFIKYQNNPKFVQAIEKLRGKLGKSGSYPGFGGTGGPGSAKPPAEQDDLD